MGALPTSVIIINAQSSLLSSLPLASQSRYKIEREDYHDACSFPINVDAKQEVHDLNCRPCVKVTRRFVEEEELGIVCKGASDCPDTTWDQT